LYQRGRINGLYIDLLNWLKTGEKVQETSSSPVQTADVWQIVAVKYSVAWLASHGLVDYLHLSKARGIHMKRFS
jgi:hypothetical protein